MNDRLMETLKIFINTFVNRVSLNVLSFTIVPLSALIYMRSKNEIAFYIGFSCLIFLVTNLLVRYIPKIYSRIKKKKLYKKFHSPSFQKKIFSKLDSYELDIIRELYEKYPDSLMYDINSSPIIALSDYLLIKGAGVLLPDVGTFTQYYTLQPWVKKALDNNKELRDLVKNQKIM